MSDERKPGVSLDRRMLLGAAATGAGVLAGGLGGAQPAKAEVLFQKGPPMTFGGGGAVTGGSNRSEIDLFDCEVEGKLPADLDGAFYRVGPDAQYPKPDKYMMD